MSKTESPPEVHALNGVAERAIKAIFSHVRADLEASGAPHSGCTRGNELTSAMHALMLAYGGGSTPCLLHWLNARSQKYSTPLVLKKPAT